MDRYYHPFCSQNLGFGFHVCASRAGHPHGTRQHSAAVGRHVLPGAGDDVDGERVEGPLGAPRLSHLGISGAELLTI